MPCVLRGRCVGWGEDVRLFGLRVNTSRCYPELLEELSPVDLGSQLLARPKRGAVARVLDRFGGAAPDFLVNRQISELLPDDLDVLYVYEHYVYPAAA